MAARGSPTRSTELHGNAPDKCRVALLLVDVVNAMDFPEGEALLRSALPAARRIARVVREARRLGVPVVYANDNFGRWRSNLNAVIEHCLQDGVRGRPIARLLRPRQSDYLILKPKHSAFFATTLEVLLRYLQVQEVVLMGFAGNICVLFTANDLYLRDYQLTVPRDCCASNTPEANEAAIEQIATLLKADVRPSSELDLRAKRGRARRKRPGPRR